MQTKRKRNNVDWCAIETRFFPRKLKIILVVFLTLLDERDGGADVLAHLVPDHEDGEPAAAEGGGVDLVAVLQVPLGRDQTDVVHLLQELRAHVRAVLRLGVEVLDRADNLPDLAGEFVVAGVKKVFVKAFGILN